VGITPPRSRKKVETAEGTYKTAAPQAAASPNTAPTARASPALQAKIEIEDSLFVGDNMQMQDKTKTKSLLFEVLQILPSS